MPDSHADRDPASRAAAPRGSVSEVARLFLRLGIIGFGGPAAHIALMEDEVVRRRRWLTREEFLDLLGATQLIPGPNSTEMAIHVGFVRAGWPGLLAGGACFIVPAMVITLSLAAAYARYGRLPEAGWILYGVKPVIIAVVVQAVWSLGRRALATPLAGAIGLLVVALALRGVNEVALLFAATLAVPVLRGILAAGGVRALAPGGLMVAAAGGATGLAPHAPAAVAGGALLLQLALVFLKVGSILFGSGYVLLAFLRPDVVERSGWLTDAQLLDAVAVGQLTPGPVLTTATFIGYQIAAIPGAIVATVGIFLPSFVFVALSSPLVPRLRRSPRAAGLLDGANAASVALMALVTWQLGRAAIVDWVTAGLAVASAVLVASTRVNSAWLVAGGAAAGALANLFRW
jgi:chromate transporter